MKDALDASMGEAEERECAIYTASSPSYAGPMKIINNFFNSDLVFSLRPEGYVLSLDNSEEGSLGRDYALVSDDMWLQTFKW